MCKEHDHIIVYRGRGNEVLCFNCAVIAAQSEVHVETEIETFNEYRCCSKCGS